MSRKNKSYKREWGLSYVYFSGLLKYDICSLYNFIIDFNYMNVLVLRNCKTSL